MLTLLGASQIETTDSRGMYPALCSTEARSIKALGISTQPLSRTAITVADEKIEQGYEILAGHTRFAVGGEERQSRSRGSTRNLRETRIRALTVEGALGVGQRSRKRHVPLQHNPPNLDGHL